MTRSPDAMQGGAPTLSLTVPDEGQIMEQLPPYDPEADRQAVRDSLERSPEIDALTSAIDVSDMNSIVTFGAGAAEQIGKASDAVLRTMSMGELSESSRLMTALAKIMEQFDIHEVRENTGLLNRLFGGAKKQLDRVLNKYQTMGDQVDRIYVELRRYESEIMRSNDQLDQMFGANVASYHELVKYIAAGEQGVKEISDYYEEREREFRRTGDPTLSFELQSLQQARDVLAQRVQDLRTAEIVAMQSIPMIRTMQYNNVSLVRKINSAFIITLPVFKQALAQAILLKRQQVQAEAVGALDRRTQEMILKNARNTAEAARLTARVTGTSVGADTLEASWKTIVDGIGETRKLQRDTETARKEDLARLEQIRKDYQAKFGS